jgi:hypothetical protein
MTNQPSKPKEAEKKPDFARGQRRQPASPGVDRGDFARGERQAPKTEDELQHPDFAEGQRNLPKQPGEHPDFARGQDSETEPSDEPDES